MPKKTANQKAWKNVEEEAKTAIAKTQSVIDKISKVTNANVGNANSRRNPRNNQSTRRRNRALNTTTSGKTMAKDVVTGYNDLLHSYFSGLNGISRGLATGIAATALCRFRYTLDVTVTAGTYMNWIFSPAAPGANTFAYSLGATIPQSPYVVTTTNSAVAAQIDTTSATSFRCVRAGLKIIPTSPVLNQGGLIFAMYNSTIYRGGPAVGTLVFTVSSTNLQQSEYKMAVPGLQTLMTQWVPNDNELPLIDIQLGQEYSGFIGYINNNTANSLSYRLEFDVGYEFVPTAAYRPYVQRDQPSTHPDAIYYLVRYVRENWMQSMITTGDTYEKNAAKIEGRSLSWAWGSEVTVAGSLMNANDLVNSKEEVKEPEYKKAYHFVDALGNKQDPRWKDPNFVNKLTEFATTLAGGGIFSGGVTTDPQAKSPQRQNKLPAFQETESIDSRPRSPHMRKGKHVMQPVLAGDRREYNVGPNDDEL